jgi:hypothetical protein
MVREGNVMAGRSFAGVLLVAIGVALLLIELTGVGGVAIVLLGGLAFLATHLATRSYGFLVPGGILTGFGASLVAEDLGLASDIGLIGLGAGFLLIPLVQLLTGAERPTGWWWPFIPGGILALLGTLEKLEGRAAGLILPGLLIILGLVFLLTAARRGPAAEPAVGGVDLGGLAGPAEPPSKESSQDGDPQDAGAR